MKLLSVFYHRYHFFPLPYWIFVHHYLSSLAVYSSFEIIG